MPPITFDAALATSTVSVRTALATFTVGAGANILYVAVGRQREDASTCNAVIWRDSGGTQSQSLTQIHYVTAATASMTMQIWRLLAPNAGTKTIQANFGSTTLPVLIGAASYSGVDQTTPNSSLLVFLQNAATNSSGISVASSANSVAVDFLLQRGNVGTQVAGAGQTERASGYYSGSAAWFGISDEAGTASVAMTWAGSAAQRYHVGFSINPASGATETSAEGSAAGISSVSGFPYAQVLGVGSLAGASTVGATDYAAANAQGSAAGSSTVGATDIAQANAQGQAAGSSTVEATGIAQANVQGSVAGVSTVGATDYAQVLTQGEAAGLASVSGELRVELTAGSAEGLSQVSGETRSDANAEGQVNAQATVSGVGLAEADTQGFVAGESNAQGILSSDTYTTGAVAGISGVSGEVSGATLTETAGSAAGDSTVSGTTTFTQVRASTGWYPGKATNRPKRWNFQEDDQPLRSYLYKALEFREAEHLLDAKWEEIESYIRFLKYTYPDIPREEDEGDEPVDPMLAALINDYLDGLLAGYGPTALPAGRVPNLSPFLGALESPPMQVGLPPEDQDDEEVLALLL